MYFSANDTLYNILSFVESTVRVLQPTATTGFDIEVKKHAQKRSNAQNNFYWLNATDVANMLNQSGLTYGDDKIGYTPAIIHEINKQKLGTITTTKMTTGEFCDFMERFFAFWIERTNGFWQPKESTRSYLERTHLI